MKVPATQSELTDERPVHRRASITPATSRTASPDGQDAGHNSHPPAYTESSYATAPSERDHLDEPGDVETSHGYFVPDGMDHSSSAHESEFHGEPPNYTPQDPKAASKVSRCDMLPNRSAVWFVRGRGLKISALAATVLLNEGALANKDLSIIPPALNSAPADAGPTDPLSGILTATSRTVVGVLGGVADYPIAMSKMTQSDPETRQREAASFALDGNKGVSRIIGTALKAPMEYTNNISQGFSNMPKLWGDDTVRQAEAVTDVKSGLKAGGMGFGLGLWDGITGLVTEPVKGAQDGVAGALGGLFKGIGGVVCKPIAGAVGLPANALKGFHEEYQKTRGMETKTNDVAALMQQGWEEFGSSSVEERSQVIAKWYQLQSTARDGGYKIQTP